MRNRIAEFREREGISQSVLAEELGISRPYLSDIENEKISNPGGKLLLRIAKRLGEKVEDVFFEEGK